MDCINKVIGISKEDCTCLGITGASDSLSGLYLNDKTIGQIPFSATVFDCTDANLTAYLADLIPSSVTETIEALSMSLEMSMSRQIADSVLKIPTKHAFSGALATANYHTFSMRPLYKGVKIKIMSADVDLFTGTFTGNIMVYQNDVKIFDDVKANLVGQIFTLTDDLIFVHAGGDPKNKKHYCCGGSYPTDGIIKLGGASFANVADFVYQDSTYTHGFQIQAAVYCDAFEFLCNFDFTQGWGMVFAKTVQLMARRNIASWIIDSGDITTYVTTNEDRLYDLMNYLQKEIDKRLEFLPTRYNYSDCYVCSSFQKTSIIV